jgi:predicted O-linked N-acetylglucosamine transferase (SPINDLY family)
MGVPVVTMAGSTPASNLGHSVLQSAWLAGYVATTEDDYVRLAQSFATAGALAHFRKTIQEQLSKSTLLNGARCAAEVTDAFDMMLDVERQRHA